MLKVAIYDDNVQDMEGLYKILLEYGNRYGGLEIKSFSELSELRSTVMNGEHFSFYVLGFDDPRKKGASFVTELQEMGADSDIILISGVPAFTMSSRDTGEIVCLNKPITKDELKSAANMSMNKYSDSDGVLTIFTPRGEKTVRLNNIMYVEVLAHTLCFYLEDGQRIRSKVHRIPFEHAARPLFHDSRFLRLHRSYLANAAFVDRMTRTEMKLKNGMVIPISRLRIQDIRQGLQEYRNMQAEPKCSTRL